MAVKYARCNAMMSLALDERGEACRYMVKAEDDQTVVDQMSQHLKNVHKVDPKELENTIRGIIKNHGR